MEAEEAYQNSIKLTEDAMVTYKCWLFANKYAGNIQVEDMPKYADADYTISYDHNFNHYVEVKTRYHRHGNYAMEKVPFRKFAFAYTMKYLYDRDTFYLIRWVDGTVGFINLSEEPDKVDQMIARHDRGEDSDLYAFYDVKKFRVIGSS